MAMTGCFPPKASAMHSISEVVALRARLRHLGAIGTSLHRMQRLPVVYKQRLDYRDKRRRAVNAP
jgi:hypothetical protein